MSAMDLERRAAADDAVSRREFLGGAATAAALGGLALPAIGATAQPHAGAAGAAAGAGAESAHGAAAAEYFGGPGGAGGDVPRVGLRWAFSATVFFADRVLINTMEAASGRGYTSVGGGEIWGPRLTGRVLPHSGADYYKAGFNTYYMFQAADGALIFIHNRGTMRRFAAPYAPGHPLVPAATGPGAAAPAWTRFRATPVFTAPFGPHDWMNRTLFVANAQRQSNPDHTVFTYYEVL